MLEVPRRSGHGGPDRFDTSPTSASSPHIHPTSTVPQANYEASTTDTPTTTTNDDHNLAK